ncbi:MAG TPA: alpha/beta hydrolase [Nocardioides sp.]|jgi:pimeloyl-ACP methyl ester carboxylesterase|nr:alpha/beta hydrolase [Nocardioides sp.]
MTATLALPDGRDLELEVTGPDGAPVLLFIHGTPGASHQLGAITRAAAARGHRLVTWSRAGYGASARRPGRDVASETADVVAVLDHLGVETCVVAGWSGGGPHALACGALIPERVRAVTSVAGVAPYGVEGLDFLAGMGEENLEELGAALDGEQALRAYLDAARPEILTLTPTQVVAQLESLLPPVDRDSVTGEFADYLATEFRQSVSVGVDGWLDDDLAFTRPWGFDLADVAVPAYLWQGSEDLMVPFSHGRWLAAHVAGATAHLEQGDGHLTILLGALDRWLDELIGTP